MLAIQSLHLARSYEAWILGCSGTGASEEAGGAMTVKQLIRKLQHPPCERIAAVRMEFADGGLYEVSADTRRIRSSEQRRRNAHKELRQTQAGSRLTSQREAGRQKR